MIPQQQDPKVTQQVKTLKSRLQRSSGLDTVSVHLSRALDYLQLEKLTKESQYIHKAIDQYTKALDLQKDAVTFCKRAKALNMVGEFDKAVDDFIKAKEFSSKDSKDDFLKTFYTNGMLQQIAKLDSVKNVINKMRAENKLPAEFLGAFEQLTNTTQRLVMKVGLQDEKIKQQGELIQLMAQKIEKLQQKMSEKAQKKDTDLIKKDLQKINKIYKNFESKMTKDTTIENMQIAIEQLKTQLKAVGVDIKQVEAKLQNVEIKLDKFIHHSEEQFKNIKKSAKNLKKSIKAFDGKFQYIEGEINSMNQKLIYIDDTLKQSLYPKKQVKDQFQKWQKENPLLYEYANNFYWVLTNYLLSYRIASTGIFDTDQASPQPSFVEENFSTILNGVCLGLQMIPFVSGIVQAIKSVVETVYEKYQEQKSGVIIRKINTLIMKYKLQEDLSTAVGQGVIKLCKMEFKLVQIDDIKNKKTNQDKNFLVKTLDQFYGQVDFAIKKWNNYKVQDETLIYGLVVEDVTALLVYILQSDFKDKDPILEAISKGFEGGYQSPICTHLKDRYKKKVQQLKAQNPQEKKDKANNCAPETSLQPKKAQQVKQDCCSIY